VVEKESRCSDLPIALQSARAHSPTLDTHVKEDGSMTRDAAARVARPSAERWNEDDVLRFGREVIAVEARALEQLVGRIDHNFFQGVQEILNIPGSLIVTGIGKAGLIGQKLTATFASTGCRSHFLHPAEAFHGDLGRVHANDVVLALSQSGETGEVLQLLPALRSMGVKLIAMTASADSTLGRAAAIVLPLGRLEEACSLGLAPSTSTTVMLALGDALALVVSRLRGFDQEDFARFHPGGALGRKLSAVNDHMRPLAECRVAQANQSVRQVVINTTKPGRRTGAVMLVDQAGRLAGLFTDSDLARLIESKNDSALDQPIHAVMAKSPTTVESGQRMTAAIEILTQRKFSELPVVDRQGRPVGMIDVTDVMSMFPETTEAQLGGRRTDFEPTIVKIFRGDDAADAEFCWPFDENPETD
jgi:arabinose-5-phosphate isomerase